jgi:hypothetical protein
MDGRLAGSHASSDLQIYWKTQQLWKYVLKKFIRELKFEGKK